MAKRTLGLGKAAKQKKQKISSETPEKSASPDIQSKGNEIHVELDEEVDPDDELNQLKGLWLTYVKGGRDNEMVLNGIIHECDRLLRNQSEETKLPAEFHSTYALALSDLANFHTEDSADSNIKQYFDAALERISLGQDVYPDSIELGFALANVIFARIPMEFISKWNVDSKKSSDSVDLKALITEALESYEKSEESVKLLKNYSLLDNNVFETLKAFDDLLEIVNNFGQEDSLAEGLDSDDEEEQEVKEIKLSKKHPLYEVYHRSSDKYFQWLVKHGSEFGTLVNDDLKHLLKKTDELSTKETRQLEFLKQVSAWCGQLLLQAAEKPSQIFTAITYDDGEPEIEGYTAAKAQEEAQSYIKQAVKFFENAEEEEDPKTWVDVAEALIDLGNVYDYESKDQIATYALAEKRLRRANNATNGKYQEILDNLLSNDD